MSRYVSIGAAAAMLGVAVSTLRRWEAEGRLLPDFRTMGGYRPLILLGILNTFFQGQKIVRLVMHLHGGLFFVFRCAQE